MIKTQCLCIKEHAIEIDLLCPICGKRSELRSPRLDVFLEGTNQLACEECIKESDPILLDAINKLKN